MQNDLQNQPVQPPVRELMLKAQVLARVRVGYSCLWEWMRDGIFPLPIELGRPNGRTTRIAWFADEVEGWIESRPRRKIGGLAEHRAAQERVQSKRGRKPRARVADRS
jgi:predicted DNA-binding transcriptional regulator AlpA